MHLKIVSNVCMRHYNRCHGRYKISSPSGFWGQDRCPSGQRALKNTQWDTKWAAQTVVPRDKNILLVDQGSHHRRGGQSARRAIAPPPLRP